MRSLDRYFNREILARIIFSIRDIINGNTTENYPSQKCLKGPIKVPTELPIKVPTELPIKVPIKVPIKLPINVSNVLQKDKLEKKRIEQLLEVISKP